MREVSHFFRSELALPHCLAHPCQVACGVRWGHRTRDEKLRSRLVGTKPGVRWNGRRSLWLAIALAAATVIAAPLLLSVTNNTEVDRDENAAGGDSRAAQGSDADDRRSAEPASPDVEGRDGTGDQPAGGEGANPVPPTSDRRSADLDTALPEDVLVGFLALTDAILTDPDDVDDESLSRLATGSALQELRSMALEFSVTDLRQAGQHDVISMVAGPSDGDEISIDACLDRSAVRLQHADGAPVLVEEADPRSLHTYVLRRSETGWQVAEHLFPEPNQC